MDLKTAKLHKRADDFTEYDEEDVVIENVSLLSLE